MFKPFILVLIIAANSVGCRTLGPTSDVSVAGGFPVSEDDRMAFVTVMLRDGNGRPQCTGTLIAPDIVLTAAHCGSVLQTASAGFGARFDPAIPPDPSRLRLVKEHIAHPCYDFNGTIGDRYGFDLMLMLLESPAPDSFGPPVDLVSKDMDIPIGSALVAAGFGRTTFGGGQALNLDGTLRYAPLESRTDQNYSERIIQLVGGPGRVFGRSLCHGDSGGPTFIKQGDSLLLVGVNSHMVTDSPPGLCADGSAVVDIRVYREWIVEAISSLRDDGDLSLPTVESCTHKTNPALALPAYQDESRGLAGCRISIGDDPNLSYVVKIGSSYSSDCNGGASLALRETSEGVSSLTMSAPKNATAAYLCSAEDVTSGLCSARGVRLPQAPDLSGKGRICFQYGLRSEDIGKGGSVIVYSNGNFKPVEMEPFTLGYRSCPDAHQEGN